MKQRGRLTEEIQKIAKSFLGREITTTELRLYPYIDYCLKNEHSFSVKRINEEEETILNHLKEEGYFYRDSDMNELKVTEPFYDYMQTLLKLSYLPEFIPTKPIYVSKKHDEFKLPCKVGAYMIAGGIECLGGFSYALF